jgi:putative photosynthetic complex assembly protein 2
MQLWAEFSLMDLVIPALFVIFLWWFTSGLIMVLFGRSRRVINLAFAGGTLLFGAAVAGVLFSRDRTDMLGVYTAYTCGTVIWGWLLASYYFDFITGPNRAMQAKSEGEIRRMVAGRPFFRFVQALRASIYHELLALAVTGMVAVLVWGRANPLALWILLVLWVMHSSAKLNVFFGVRNFRIEFLPDHMRFLGGFVANRTINSWFPFSIILGSGLVFVLAYQALWLATQPTMAIGYLMVALMVGLGALEHWLLVLPVPAAIWGWGVRTLPQPSVVEVEISS